MKITEPSQPQSGPRSYAARASHLVTAIHQDAWGKVGPSIYETAQVLSAAPWLEGHEKRLQWLLKQQQKDGSWGDGPAPYRLLPTLSAVEALLSHIRSRTSNTGQERMAATTGLAAVRNLPPSATWPDTAAIEILVPSLVSRINSHLGTLTISTLPRLGPWSNSVLLGVPKGFHPSRHEQVAERCRAAGTIPAKLHHTYEGIARHIPAHASPAPDGLLGSSPAATSAWAATTPSPRTHCEGELARVAQQYDGGFPEAAPITTYERLWAAAALAGPGLPESCRPTIARWAADIYVPSGVRGAPGLMPDADDTAMAVLVATLASEPRDPAPLSAFWSQHHYACYIGEDTGSVTANAHALQALHAYGRRNPQASAAHHPRAKLTRDWLLSQQHPDGSWTDKWHASPYYATQRCVTALMAHDDRHVNDAVRTAAEWTLATQHPDGSWGIWGGTAEETAYAAKILLSTTPTPRRQPAHTQALKRAEAILHATATQPHPPLWHDKTLYAPQAMIKAEIWSALEMLRIHHAPTTGDQ